MTASILSSRQRFVIYIATATLGAILSIYAAAATDVINKDGTLYIYTAEAFLNGGFSEMLPVFSWPFYPITIAWFHALSGASLETSAYTVNALLLIIFSIACLRVYEEICTQNLSLWIPALLILALPIVNDYRVYVIRGHGFLAFMLLALLFFIKYYKQPSIRNALLWQCFATIGTLFRIEGVVFLALAPFYFLFQDNNLKVFIRHFIRLNSVLIPMAIAAIISLLSIAITTDGYSNALQQYLSYMLPTSTASALSNIASEIQGIMPRLSSSESTLVVTAGLTTLLCYKLIKNLNIAYLIIWFIGRKKKWVQLSQESNIVLFFAFISILPLIVLAGNQFFMSSRYTVLPVTLFSLVAYQYVGHLLHKLVKNRRYIAVSALAILITIFFLDAIIHTGANKQNIIAASRWVQQNIDHNSKIACNEGRLFFYSNKTCTHEVKLARKGIAAYEKLLNHDEYDYLLLWIDHKHKKIRDYLQTNKRLTLVKAFSNKKHDEVIVYRIQP